MLNKFGVLILNRNGKKWVDGLLSSLEKDQCLDKRLYFIDNASTDGSLNMAKMHKNIACISFEENLGFSRAYNIAAEIAFRDGCSWVVLLNTDITVELHWLHKLDDFAARMPKAGIIGPVLKDWDGNLHPFMKAKYTKKQLQAIRQGCDVNCDWVQGSCLAISMKCWRSIGGLDEDLFFYWEDADICRRALYNGFSVCICSQSNVRHYGGGSSDTSDPKLRFLNKRLICNHYAYKVLDPCTESSLISLYKVIRLFISYSTEATKKGALIPILMQFKYFLEFIPSFFFWRKKRYQFIRTAINNLPR